MIVDLINVYLSVILIFNNDRSFEPSGAKEVWNCVLLECSHCHLGQCEPGGFAVQSQALGALAGVDMAGSLTFCSQVLEVDTV